MIQKKGYFFLIGILISASICLAVPQTGSNSALIDGVKIEAVESPLRLDGQQIDFFAGIYPFNPYYTGFIGGLNYIAKLNQNVSWRVLSASMVFSVKTNLEITLADQYLLNPISIDEISYIIGSDLLYHIAQGKFLMFGSWLRYFQTSVSLGAGLIKTTQITSPCGQLGLRIRIYGPSSLSWFFDTRDYLAISNQPTFNLTNYITFALGTGFTF